MTLFSGFLFSRNDRWTRRPSAKSTRRKALLDVEALESRRLLSAATISGFVYSDANNNGLFDPGEQGIANSPIVLRNSSGTTIGSTTTDANGHYIFNQDNSISTAGTTKTVTLTFPNTKTNWTQAQNLPQFDPSLGTLTAIDIVNKGSLTSQIRVESMDQSPATITAQASGSLTLSGPGLSLTTLGSTPLLPTAQSVQTFSAGAYDGVSDFTGTSGHDFGPQTATGSQSVTLTAPSDLAPYIGTGTVSLTESATATSSASGAGNLLSLISSTAGAEVDVTYHYIQNNSLQPGNYTVVQTSQPAGYLDGQLTSGNITPIPNSVGTHAIAITLNNGNSANNNFAAVSPSSLAGFVYIDNNNDGVKEAAEPGISGVTVTLSGTDDLGQTVSLSQATAADGSYQFQGLRPGNYTLKERLPDGQFLEGTDAVGSQGGSVSEDQISNIVLAPGTTGTDNDFAELRPASLAGFVYKDPNNNGVKDNGESGIAGVAVSLTGTDDLGDSVSLSQTTAADGSYSFTGLRPGSYTLADGQPAGFFDGKNTIGSQGGTASSTQLSGINLTFGVNGVNNNFGELAPASVSGSVYDDRAHAGVKQAGDPGIANVAIALAGTDDVGNHVSLSTTTAADGSYSFTSLRPGAYTITETQPSGFLEGTNNVGSLGGTTANDAFIFNVNAGDVGVNYNFGELDPAPAPVAVQDVLSPTPPNPTPVVTKRSFLMSFWQRHGLAG
jgi:protocatechuate 3,4-dioxygenase beta subunit